MNVHFWIPGPLMSLTGGRSHVDVKIPLNPSFPHGGRAEVRQSRTLKDALDALFAAYPGIRDRVVTEQGEIREHVNVFVGKDEARSTGGLLTPVANGTEISIIPAISGG
jgi:molybdopterin converting factor small subunit